MIVVALGEVNPMRPQSYEKGMEYEKTKKIEQIRSILFNSILLIVRTS